MSFDAQEGPRRTFVLGGGRVIQLRPDGISHPVSILGGAQAFTPYEEVTHVSASRHWLWLGATRSVYPWPRRVFADRRAPEALVEHLLAVLANRSGGEAQLAAMGEIEAREAQAGPRVATALLVATCLLAFGLQRLGDVYEAGYFSRPLFVDGDVWRLLAANLVHWSGWHLAFDLALVAFLGRLVERALGAAGVALVFAGAGAAGMGLAGFADPRAVVGSSGLVFGLAGALLWIEMNWAREVPAGARLPRFWLVLFLVLTASMMLLFPVASAFVHLGGFAGGVAGAMLAGGPARGGEWPRGRALAGTLAALAFALSGLRVGWDALGDPAFRWRHAQRLAELPEVAALDLNNLAWKIAIAPDRSRRELEAALPLAERAVEETGRRLAPLLDTLAELQFQLGRVEEALVSIDAAIEAPCDPVLYGLLAGREDACQAYQDYYREQRARFAGERPAADRPLDPMERPPAPPPDPPAPPPGLEA